MSGALYTIYTNEILLLHTLMNNPIYKTLTGKPKISHKLIEHDTINFVNDSTNVIYTKNTNTLLL